MYNDAKIKLAAEYYDLIKPFNESNLQAHSYDLTLGTNFKVPDPTTKGFFESYDLEQYDSMSIASHAFLLAHSAETIHIPQTAVGFVCGKSTIARNGLQIEAAGLLDSTFTGQITLELYNMSPWNLDLKVGMPIAQVYFFNADSPQFKLYRNIGNYQNQTDATIPHKML